MAEEMLFSTPMMLQYMQLKSEYPDCLLWFRLGDFYEMFLEQAEVGSAVLGITLTSRSRGKDGRIPMAGIPYHAAETYLAKLIQAGHRVAICEQVSEPNGKTLVDRKVVRIITPGTILDEKTLQAKNNNFLACCLLSNEISLAITDLTTGELKTGNWSLHSNLLELLSEVRQKYHISEWVLAPELADDKGIREALGRYSTSIITSPSWLSDWLATRKETTAEDLLRHYIEYTQQTPAIHLQPATPILPTNFVRLDESSILNLELFQTLYYGQKVGSLLHVLDQTQTAMGGRLLKQWLREPLCQQQQIEKRLMAVELLTQEQKLREIIAQELKQIKDLERLISRLSLGVGNPRDIVNLKHSFGHIQKLSSLLEKSTLPFAKSSHIKQLSQLQQQIETTLVEHPPLDPKAGNLIQTGVHQELDALKKVITNSQDILSQIEIEERKRTGISSLKIKYNQVFGFYIEISKANLHLVPPEYYRKQTLVNAERFITDELKQQEDIILSAEEKSTILEFEIFQDLVRKVLSKVSFIQAVAHSVAQLDCLLSLAEVAVLHDYAKPHFNEQGLLHLEACRHPVVEVLIPHHRFIPNTITLDLNKHRMLLLTGPNMAGKSVLMRQVALNTLLAHMGSFVPAAAANIPLTDQIFVRSGASDIITSGLSTFMVEMVETAAILKNATQKSLVIMDEIGRGTSTYDGISIAWAIAEFLINTGCKTLFATHYHELQQLAEYHPSDIRNVHMAVSEESGKPVFLYTLKAGGASHSFGIAVAELAGLPATVIEQAKKVLSDLETRVTHPQQKLQATQLPLPLIQESVDSDIIDELRELSTDKLTPIAALNLIDKWKNKLS